MVSYSFITDNLATGGGIVSKDDITVLAGVGITNIIDMRAEFDDDLLADVRDKILWLPQQDDGTPRDPKQILQGIGYALTVLSTPGHKIFCHCAQGINRGPLQTYAILRAFGIPRQEAIDRIRTKRPEVGFYNVANYLNSVEQALA